ncbi:transcriptional regulator opi1 [Coemansia sp. BCRC 34301]|nr:transcriptional regulator opi1 [Coemansia sp. BCRC 34301]
MGDNIVIGAGHAPDDSGGSTSELSPSLLSARESTVPCGRVSIAELVNDTTVDHTTAEAAEALGILRGTGEDESQRFFIQRVQAIPLVNSALGIYDRSRQSSALLRAGTSVIESGVRKMCQPITKRIDVAQLDSFACRQLDNLGYSSAEATGVQQPTTNLRKRTKDQAEDPPPPPVEDDNGKGKAASTTGSGGRWRVGSLVASARDRAVAYREDSVRRLRYCLEWVAYATALLRQRIGELQRLLAAVQEAARTALVRKRDNQPLLIADHDQPEQLPEDVAERLARARREIVGAVRRAVGVVSNYAGSVLPSEARRQVRDLILNLPGRWAAVDSASSAGGSCSPSVASAPGSPGGPPSEAVAQAHIDVNVRRTLAFATESFYMLDSVRAVFQGLYSNAERWIGAPPVSEAEFSSRTAYRDQPPAVFAEYAVPPWQRPQGGSAAHRLPLNTATGGEGGGSLGDIGERMRRMDVDGEDDIVSFKRNRTREPTPH